MGNQQSLDSALVDVRNDTEFDVIDEDPTLMESEVEANPNIVENVKGSLTTKEYLVESKYREIRNIQKKLKRQGQSYLYNDPDFPSDAKSLHYPPIPSRWEKIKWQRPTELSENPSLMKDGFSSEDIRQGSLGDCWFLASCAAMSRSPKFFRKVIPKHQDMTGPNYVGLFHFRFWRFGQWVDVIIDDALPTLNGSLFFGHSSDPDEFWLPLVEKAYAKFHKSYQAIEGGSTTEALEDLTGGIAVRYDLGPKTPNHLFIVLKKATRSRSFVCAAISRQTVNSQETGLIGAHAYTVLKVSKVTYKAAKVSLVKIRNPWGNSTEWKGDWSDESPTWDHVSKKVKRKLYENQDNGEWWMTIDDLSHYFSRITVCTVGPDFDGDGAPSGDRWLRSMIYGEWAVGKSDAESLYLKNPQYFMELTEPDDFDPDEDEPEEEGKCSVALGLMQESVRALKPQGAKNLHLSLSIYKVKERPKGKLQVGSLDKEVLSSGNYTNRHEVTVTGLLDPGYYVVVPSVHKVSKTSKFLLRIFTEKPVDLQKLN